MKWIFQRFFFPYLLCDIARIQCAACSGFAVRHVPDSVCDMLRIMQKPFSLVCEMIYVDFNSIITLIRFAYLNISPFPLDVLGKLCSIIRFAAFGIIDAGAKYA